MKKKIIFLTTILFTAIQLSAQVTDIEGNTYKTVKIGEQEWMAENLKTARFQNGDSIPTGKFFDVWESFDRPPSPGFVKMGWHNYYNWMAVNDERGLCPAGWKIPDNDDWQQLIDFLGGEEVAGKKLKSTEGWAYEEHIYDEDDEDYFNYTVEVHAGNGTNESGFNAKPGDIIESPGYITDYPVGMAHYWSQNRDNLKAYYIRLMAGNDNIEKSGIWLNSGLHVRCLRITP